MLKFMILNIMNQQACFLLQLTAGSMDFADAPLPTAGLFNFSVAKT
jgi:hypothetical protein